MYLTLDFGGAYPVMADRTGYIHFGPFESVKVIEGCLLRVVQGDDHREFDVLDDAFFYEDVFYSDATIVGELRRPSRAVPIEDIDTGGLEENPYWVTRQSVGPYRAMLLEAFDLQTIYVSVFDEGLIKAGLGRMSEISPGILDEAAKLLGMSEWELEVDVVRFY